MVRDRAESAPWGALSAGITVARIGFAATRIARA
jgi:hypothetical protein